MFPAFNGRLAYVANTFFIMTGFVLTAPEDQQTLIFTHLQENTENNTKNLTIPMLNDREKAFCAFIADFDF